MIECMCGVVFAHERCRQVLQGGGGGAVATGGTPQVRPRGTHAVRAASLANDTSHAQERRFAVAPRAELWYHLRDETEELLPQAVDDRVSGVHGALCRIERGISVDFIKTYRQ